MSIKKSFVLDASNYEQQAALELAKAKARMHYYREHSTKPFLNANAQFQETMKPTNTLFFFKHLTQLMFGTVVAIKTLLTDPISLLKVFKGMFDLALTMMIDVLNVVASGVSCLMKIIPTIISGYGLKKGSDEREKPDDESNDELNEDDELNDDDSENDNSCSESDSESDADEVENIHGHGYNRSSFFEFPVKG